MSHKISSRVRTIDIDNHYDIYLRIFPYGSSMIEGVSFAVWYVPVIGIKHLRIIISIASAEYMITFLLDISNEFHNDILPNPKELFYLSLPYI